MVNPTFRRIVSPVLDPIGYALLMTRAADLGMARRHGSRERRQIALTFDDGPVRGGTEQVLDVLGEFGVPGTFFCIGANVRMHPDILRRTLSEGHVIGAHSMQHSRIATVSLRDTEHIDACVDAIREETGKTPALYRPPWGWLTPWETLRLRQRNMEIIRWDIETPDSLIPCPNEEAIYKFAAERVQPGSIIVFHDGMTHADHHDKRETAHALRLLVPFLRDAGYACVTVPALLGIAGYRD